MDIDYRTLSPARRARRCLLGLLVSFLLVAVAYMALRTERPPLIGKGTVIASSGPALERNSSSASTSATATRAVNQPSGQFALYKAYAIEPGRPLAQGN